uniref:Uncharacterized protein n=1 Tax=Nelumbo nucifera TaxID=4432 RepID=A0A822ZSN6_NELNU|nr:TPA_asm: hypothetical protein HUJ06_018861 [Nelumbo nucifera]
MIPQGLLSAELNTLLFARFSLNLCCLPLNILNELESNNIMELKWSRALTCLLAVLCSI